MLARRIRIREAKRELERLEALAPYLDRKDLKRIRSAIVSQIKEEDDHPKTQYKDRFTGEVRRKMDELDEMVQRKLEKAKKKGMR